MIKHFYSICKVYQKYLFVADKSHSNSFCSFQRPLLVILDRNQDMATPLHHTWTYQALAHDVLVCKLPFLKINAISVVTF